MKTEVLLDHEPVADGGWIVRTLLKLEGDAPPAESRTPLNLALVLDRSGSMRGRPLERALEAARLVARRLWPEDIASVVAFGSNVETIATHHTGADRSDLIRRIDSIRIEGNTNLSGGWLKGRDLVARTYIAGQVNRILLLTDGIANEGITDPIQLTALCRAAAQNGITTSTIGFGTGYNERLLAAMAEAGRGHTYYIESPDQAPAIFEEEIEGLLTLAAQNATVHLQTAPEVELVAIHHAYPTHMDGATLVAELGDLYAREPKLLLAEFLIPPAEEGTTVTMATFEVNAYVLTPGGGIERRTINLPITIAPTGEGHVEPDVRREWLVLEAARARREALERRDRGDFLGASEVLREAYDTLSAAPESLASTELLEEAIDLHTVAEQIAAYGVSAADAKYLHQRAYDKLRGRKLTAERISRTDPRP